MGAGEPSVPETAGGTRVTDSAGWLAEREAVPVSLTVPLRREPYDWPGPHPFFENQLPEGWLLEIATTRLEISSNDAFGLLRATCADCAGAVEIVPVDDDEAST